MRRSYSVASARAKLAQILDEVAAGEEVDIVRRGRRVAILVAPARYERLQGDRTAFSAAYDAFCEGNDLAEFGVDTDWSKSLRERTPGRVTRL